MRRLTLVLVAIAGLVARAQEADAGIQPLDAGVAAAHAKQTIFVLNLEANDDEPRRFVPTASQDLAFRLHHPSLEVLTASDMANALGRERQAQLLGCSDGSCLAELSQALGARYLVSGRLDKIGAKFILTASLFDSTASKSVARTREEFDEIEALPAATKKSADALLTALGLTPPPEAAPPPSTFSHSGLNLSLRLGTQFFTSLVTLSPQLELEFGWRFNLHWSAIFQITSGFTVVPTLTATVTPGLLGVRYNFLPDGAFQPTLGSGVGLFATIQAAGRVRPSVVLFGGLQYFPLRRLGLSLEANVDVLGAAFDFVERTSGGINFGLALGVTWRF